MGEITDPTINLIRKQQGNSLIKTTQKNTKKFLEIKVMFHKEVLISQKIERFHHQESPHSPNANHLYPISEPLIS